MIQIQLLFGWRTIVFLILLETITVPIVALSNQVVATNIWYLASMGFGAAFVAVLLLVALLKLIIRSNLPKIMDFTITNVYGLVYLSFLAGVLLMIMFIAQWFLFEHGFNDYITGFISAFISVGLVLVIYEGVAATTDLAIKLGIGSSIYRIRLSGRDIFKLAIIFGIYEFVVCPITGLWMNSQEHRLALAISSGIAGGALGGCIIAVLAHILPFFLASIYFICEPD